MTRITVYRNCHDRYPACHDHCERYLTEKATEQQALDNYRDKNRGNSQLKQIYSERKVKKMRRFKDDLW